MLKTTYNKPVLKFRLHTNQVAHEKRLVGFAPLGTNRVSIRNEFVISFHRQKCLVDRAPLKLNSKKQVSCTEKND